MTLVALIRHMPTAWNDAGRLQGRVDTPLAAAADWRLPPELAGFCVLTSPLRRAVETAGHLGFSAPAVEPRLGEMDWGAWEGQTLAELRCHHGAAMAALEARGLDFRPPGGESPRDVQTRVAALLAEIAASRRPVVAITHKGVIRAVLALATAWDMRGKPPARLSWSAAHLFRLDPAGRPSVERLNLALERR
jgi:probable phosphoglycerate mutase